MEECITCNQKKSYIFTHNVIKSSDWSLYRGRNLINYFPELEITYKQRNKAVRSFLLNGCHRNFVEQLIDLIVLIILIG